MLEWLDKLVEFILSIVEVWAIIATIASAYYAQKSYKLSKENSKLKNLLQNEELCNFKNEKPFFIKSLSNYCTLLQELPEVDQKFFQDVRGILIELNQRFGCIFSPEEVKTIEHALNYLKSPSVSPDKLLEYLQTISSNLKKERIFDYEYHKPKS